MARRRTARLRRGPVAALLVAAAAVVALLTTQKGPTGLPTQGVVAEAVDGDTLHVQAGGKRHTLRLIGVDTPECHPSDKLDRDVQRSGQDRETIVALGRRAAKFTRKLCDGKSCRVEYDPANAARGHRDRYGRLLAYVWVAGGGGQEVLVNAEIIRQGYGMALTSYDFAEGRKAEFLGLQREARAKRRGLWGEWKP